jgi:soluble lytic murein transglycosylase-like protein
MQRWRKIGLSLLMGFAVQATASDLAILHNGFSILHTRREELGSVTRLYTAADGSSYVDIATEQIDHFEHAPNPPAAASSAAAPKPEQNLDQVINAISDRHHIDPDFINSVIHAESGFNQHAVSPKGAQGLMQLMPGTATQLGVTNAFDAGDNVEGGTRYLRELLERYNFDAIKALAAYNAGPGRVEQYRGVPPYAETRAYVARIIRDYNRKKLAEQKIAAASGKKARVATEPAAGVKQSTPSKAAP